MPRHPNQVATSQFTVSVNERLLPLLDELVESGEYGKNRAEAIERVMSHFIRDAVDRVRKVPVVPPGRRNDGSGASQ
jgi:Arc/MetJ-type ribon-helix-helix transcriptional regulator